MKRATTATLAFLGCMALFALAGCWGDFASPTTTTTTTTTTTYTTTTTAAAELSQDNNKAICVGLLNIGSCNTVQVNTQMQTVHKVPGVPAPAPSNDMTGAQMVGTTVLLCLGFIFCMFVASIVMGNRGYN